MRTRPTTIIVALLAAAALMLMSAPGIAAAAPTRKPSPLPGDLQPAKQPTSFQRTGTAATKLAATAAASEIRWELRNSNTAGSPDAVVSYGAVTAVAIVTGDWDGNGTTTIGVAFARSDGQIGWHLRNANAPGRPDVVVAYGGLDALVITVGDWDGNGTETVGAVYERSGELEWQERDSNTPGVPDHVFRYGGLDAGGLVAGDWDGNGSSTPGVVY